jgi:hypothetical protein
MRVEDAIAAAGLNAGGRRIEDSWIRAKCPACKKEWSLAALPIGETGSQADYTCRDCEAVVVTVSPAPGLGGYRLKDNVVNALGGMEIDVPPGD